ncbi:MAG: cupin fold metalloprotein, WbuC family [Erysipelotrichia bacterium]|nr:cupin fold metalloprotein, WbuC family [Erysipelotrichia bacterium]
MKIDKAFLSSLIALAKENPRKRTNYDLRTSANDGSQRMLNALMPATEVPIHRHPNSIENVICLCGRMDEIFYDNQGVEIERIHLAPSEGVYGCVVPANVWHSVEVYEPSVIYEGKDGKYGEDGSEIFTLVTKENQELVQPFNNSWGDLEKNIEYLIGMERHSGSMEVIPPLYVSRILNVPLDEVEEAMKEMGV